MSKYNARKVVIDGITFDSKAEAARYQELALLHAAGEIGPVEVHRRFVIVPKDQHGRAICYEADFVYTERGRVVVEDVKGVRTDVYKIKRRLFLRAYPEIDFREVAVK